MSEGWWYPTIGTKTVLRIQARQFTNVVHYLLYAAVIGDSRLLKHLPVYKVAVLLCIDAVSACGNVRHTYYTNLLIHDEAIRARIG